MAIISFILAWKMPFFWLVFLWSLWVMAQQGREQRKSVHTGYEEPRPQTERPRRHSLYDLLEVSPSASPEVIKAAYRQLAIKYHPDRQSGDKARQVAEERMKAINAAYEILSDPVRRAEYDRQLRDGVI